MLVAVDKRGSINLPASLRRELGVAPGTYLELSVAPGGAITLYPVEIYRSIKLSDPGLQKMTEARASEKAAFPDWFAKELANARTDTE
ncbi:MAG TPA: hypothetical protein ENN39_04280 [Desulfonatronum sp.]|nr:hypothetical protein [Desulfonatronum sp.]